MDTTTTFGVALTFLSFAIVYVTIKNRGLNQGQNNKEKNIELIIYKKEIDRLEERLRRKEISKDDYEILGKNLGEQHQKNMTQIYISKIK
jgi:hypothetical protein